jgi:hypothetical protein
MIASLLRSIVNGDETSDRDAAAVAGQELACPRFKKSIEEFTCKIFN